MPLTAKATATPTDALRHGAALARRLDSKRRNSATQRPKEVQHCLQSLFLLSRQGACRRRSRMGRSAWVCDSASRSIWVAASGST
jgi:hypothetical protein